MKNSIIALCFFLISTCLFFHKLSAQNSKKPVYVIVHGAWGGSWAFKKVDSILTEKGCTVYRPSLTGQGERVHLASLEVGLNTHINDVVNTILYEDLRNVILVGHSYGGMVVTGVADKVGNRIHKIIYLDAFFPFNGENVKDTKGNDWKWFAKMEKDGFLIPEWVKEPKIPGDVPHPVKTMTDTLRLNTDVHSKVNSIYILTVDKGKKPEDDSFFMHYERAKQKNKKVLILESDHNPQWSAIDKLVEMLYGLK